MTNWGLLQAALNKILDPETGKGLLDAGKIKGLAVSDEGRATMVLEVSANLAPAYEPVRVQAEVAATTVKGITSAQVVLTAENPPGAARTPPIAGKTADSKPLKKPKEMATPKPKLSGVRNIIAIASGKGGVGKSTVTLNLALLLQEQGLKVGILDADIYGPSLPRLTGMEGRRPRGNVDNQAIPINAFGLQVLSIGFMLKDPRAAMIWRGPMVQQALMQLLKQAQWGPSETDAAPLDVLLIDMPPGTGDVQLSLAQQVQVDGALVVSTPQDLALLDARKGISLFNKVDVPILGLIENMATFICDVCGTAHPIFGNGGVEAEAETLGLPFLGAVPLTLALRLASDQGTPLPIHKPNDPALTQLRKIAMKLTADFL